MVSAGLSGGGSKTSYGRGNILTGAQKKLLKDFLLPEAKSRYEESPDYSYFPGPTQGTLSSLEGLEEMARNFNQPGGIGDVGRNTRNSLNMLINPSGPEYQEFFRQAVTNPLLESFNEDILPQISRENLRSGFYGSQRLDAIQRANEDLVNELVKARYQHLTRGLELAAEGAASADADALARILNASDLVRQIESERRTLALDERARRMAELIQIIMGQTVTPVVTRQGTVGVTGNVGTGGITGGGGGG